MSAASWSGGYVADVPYVFSFLGEQSPLRLQFALMEQGWKAAPPLGAPFTYCELGCGNGFTTHVLAAAHPEGAFYATDFMPDHIAYAREFAASAGLENAHFYDDSFADFLERDLPQFDYITAHGVYAWVSDEVRAQIDAFVAKRLKPGGVFYVSYNCLPGWAPIVPIQKAIQGLSGAVFGDSVRKAQQALEFLKALHDGGTVYATRYPAVNDWIGSMQKQAPSYLAHEYLNHHWGPLAFAEVAARLERARLGYACQVAPLANIDAINISVPNQERLRQITDVTLRETLKDHCANAMFRTDIWVRGPRRLTAPEQAARWDAMEFVALRPPEEAPQSIAGALGPVTLSAAIVQPVLEALWPAPLSFAALREKPGLKSVERAHLIQTLALLVGAAVVAPALAENKAASASVSKLNAAILERTRQVEELKGLASPRTKMLHDCDRVTQLFVAATQQGVKNPEDAVWSLLEGLGQRLARDGKALFSRDENIQELKARYDVYKKKTLPQLRSLGII
jgi:SAM-dependent methyltransferase